MGGHGALTIGLKHPDLFKSISAFSPISNPISVPWGQKAFSGYLGDDKESWKQYDATELVSNGLIDGHLLCDYQTALIIQLCNEGQSEKALQRYCRLRATRDLRERS